MSGGRQRRCINCDVAPTPEWVAEVSFSRNGKEGYGCSGSAVNDKYVLTAGHCCDESTGERIWILHTNVSAL